MTYAPVSIGIFNHVSVVDHVTPHVTDGPLCAARLEADGSYRVGYVYAALADLSLIGVELVTLGPARENGLRIGASVTSARLGEEAVEIKAGGYIGNIWGG